MGIVEIVLCRAGYRVLSCTDPTRALQYCDGSGPAIDLLLTDIAMPEMDGPQLAAIFRQRSPRTKVLYMTGHATRAALERGLTNSDDILRKPFMPRELQERVERALQRSFTAGAC